MYNSGGSYVYVPVIRGHYGNKHSSASHFEAFIRNTLVTSGHILAHCKLLRDILVTSRHIG